MKLCSVCDKKIAGSWCKNCRRFVKTYEISDGVHMNESHNPANDPNCDYHGTTSSTVRQHNTTRSASTAASSSANNKTQRNKKAGGAFAKIVKWYIIFMVLGSVLPMVWSAVSKEKESEKDSVVSEQRDKEVSKVLDLLEDLEPEEEETTDFGETEYYHKYYDPEEIKELNVSCDSYHMELTATDFDEILKDCFGEMQSWEYYENESHRYNYLEERDNGEKFVYFNTWRSYQDMDCLTVSLNYDTASGDLHDVQVIVDLDTMDMKESIAFCQELLEEMDDAYELTSEEFLEAVESIMEEEMWESSMLHESDSIWANLIKSGENRYSIYIQ